MNANVTHMRAKLARLAAMLYHRRLLDTAGGNISARVGDMLCLSPAYSGSLRQWQLEPEDVLVVDLESASILEGSGKLSRESNVHFRLHREFGSYGTAVIHAHAQNIMVFAAMAKSMPPVLEANLKFGEAKVVEYAPAHTTQLAENIVNAIRGQEERIQKQAAGVIAPWHGLFLMGKDLDAAFDAVERFDMNARCILMAQSFLGTSDMLAAQRTALAEGVARFKKA
ncbi:MAG: class II aldolase/adducin family protein [Anaerolineae bacterium]|nr:class II aldolase/adducin family protein [Anaerolineae bacterium]